MKKRYTRITVLSVLMFLFVIYGTRGEILVLRVTRLDSYKGEKTPPGLFQSDDGVSYLNLITCEGIWNKETENYSDRLVVTLVRE